jgi:hypothetical protein
MQKRHLVPAAVLTLLAATPIAVEAQADFMFGHPKAQVTLRAGPMLHRAGGDLFGFFTSELTLERSDFLAPTIGGEAAIFVHPRIDVAVGVAVSNVESGSEFREWVDQDDQPIEQTTRLRVIPATASFRYYPMERGREISELAWLPARATPYVGAGGGMAWYRLEQVGDFVDSEDLGIFPAVMESRGHAAIGHALAGLDLWFTPRIGMNFEGRYTIGSAEPGRDFQGYDTIDLSGLQLALGVAYRW